MEFLIRFESCSSKLKKITPFVTISWEVLLL
jgi:hypothetical protein